MGYEYKITVKLSEKQKEKVKSLLMKSNLFNKIYQRQDIQYLDFRIPENEGIMPCLTISFSEEGLYVLQNGSSYLWQYLVEIQEYFENNNILYKTIEIE